ncbi:hypothetical protein C0991_002982, partial [Blastosporella zonata]
MPAQELKDLMQIWAARESPKSPPFNSEQHLYNTIDLTPVGSVSWQSFSIQYNGTINEGNTEAAPWKLKEFIVWYCDPCGILHNQLGNPDFAKKMDYSPKHVFDEGDKCRYRDFMSGNWDTIADDPNTHGATFCPIILGSNKTTVSVATGQTEYYPA